MPERNTELPDPSPELVLVLALVGAFMEQLPKKARPEFLAAVDRNLGITQAAYNVIKFRPAAEDAAVFRALKQARAWWRHAIGALTWL